MMAAQSLRTVIYCGLLAILARQAVAQPVPNRIDFFRTTASVEEDDVILDIVVSLVFIADADPADNTLTQPIMARVSTADIDTTAQDDYISVNAERVQFTVGSAVDSRQTVTVRINEDMLVEGNEDFMVTFDPPGTGDTNNFVIADRSTMIITILDDDFPIRIGLVPVPPVSEGETAEVCVRIMEGETSGRVFTINYFTSDNQAQAGSDYTAVGDSFTFSDGVSEQQCFDVQTQEDGVNEVDECFNVNISPSGNPPDLTLSPSVTPVCIQDDDPTIIGLQPVDDVEEGQDSQVCISINNSGGSVGTRSFSIDYTTENIGEAIGPGDYTPTSGTFVFSASTPATQCFDVPTSADGNNEPTECFNVRISQTTSSTALSLSPDTTMACILDTNAVVQPEFTRYDVPENVGSVRICVDATGLNGGDITVNANTADLVPPEAEAGRDYTPVSDSLSFNSANTMRCVTIFITNDPIVEPRECFEFSLTSTSGAILPQPVTPVCIIDDDEPSVGFNPTVYTTDEEDNGAILVCVEVLSQGTLQSAVAVSARTQDGSAMAPMDYSAFTGRILSFSSGSSMGQQQCTNVEIRNDDILENDREMFSVSIESDDANIPSGREEATITLRETNDEVVFGIESPDYTVTEADVEQQICVVIQEGILTETVIINMQSEEIPGGATANVDYDNLNTDLTFPRDLTRQCANVQINDDDIVEDDEGFNVRATLSTGAPLGVSVRDAISRVTILDFDRVGVRIRPPVNPDVPEDVPTGVVTICVEVESGGLAPGQTAIVSLETDDNTALEPFDYTGTSVEFTFTPSNINQMLCVDIPIEDDEICEGDERFIIRLTSDDQDVTILSPSGFVNIQDDDVAEIGLNVVEPEMFEGMLQECADEGLWFRLQFDSDVRKADGRECTISVRTENGTALSGYDFSALISTCTFSADNTYCEFHIDILDDMVAEENEYFSIIVSSNNPSRCIVNDVNTTVQIRDDEDCIDEDSPCGDMEFCQELMCPNNYTCVREAVGDDPHFAVTLATGKTLCYTVQGEHGFAFNLISNQKVYMNAMFVPDAYRDEVTWLGTMGIVINNNGYKKSNMTKLRFEAIKNLIHIDNQMILEARNIERITLKNGKLMISEAPPTEGYKQPFVRVDLKDVELSFSIKFMTEHLDLYWHSTGQKTADSHGLIGQFFHSDVWLDEVRKILILPGKEPVPVQRKPLWAFMERESGDSTNFCWVAMNPGFQGEGLIDGSYFDYLVDDVLSTEFKFKKL